MTLIDGDRIITAQLYDDEYEEFKKGKGEEIMLKPAILYKTELEKLFYEHIYDNDAFFYMGYRYCFTIPDFNLQDNQYRWAIVGNNNKVIGYLAYKIDDTCDTVNNFGLYSFDKGNPLIGKDLFTKMEELISKHRRIEWRCVGCNPVAKHYDKFCAKHNGNKIILHKTTKDHNGNYTDDYIYEILSKEGEE